ncbi:MAG TPA: hypothetical protein VJU77_06415 [Chthoniobacterales bacterium]|nr:hypothetical protein [Chthoniobacterales bacterium]
MSQSQFSTLMSQYGGEAEQQKVAEHRADRRHQTFQTVRRVCLLLLLVAAFAAATVYRGEVQTVITKAMDKFHGPSAYTKAETNTRNKIADISKQAEQRKEAIEATYK